MHLGCGWRLYMILEIHDEITFSCYNISSVAKQYELLVLSSSYELLGNSLFNLFYHKL